MSDPTRTTYEALSIAYDRFNRDLFSGQLPHCLITMQRKNGTYGYFAGERFGTRAGDENTDEIALNPQHFAARSSEDILSTLAHEMVHLWQHHVGTPSRTGYHNKQWAATMKAIGLIPSSTGAPGGKETGQRMSHYIAEDGLFARVCADLARQGVNVAYVDLWGEETARKRKTKAASKTKYSCPFCALNAWAKPGVLLVCGECRVVLQEAFLAAAGEKDPEVPRGPDSPQPS